MHERKFTRHRQHNFSPFRTSPNRLVPIAYALRPRKGETVRFFTTNLIILSLPAASGFHRPLSRWPSCANAKSLILPTTCSNGAFRHCEHGTSFQSSQLQLLAPSRFSALCVILCSTPFSTLFLQAYTTLLFYTFANCRRSCSPMSTMCTFFRSRVNSFARCSHVCNTD